MYLHDNIWRSHRGDHFTEGHRRRSAAVHFFRRRSRSAAVAGGCAANQDTDIFTADNIKKRTPGQQDTNILLTKTKMPTSLNQESWRKLFGWRLLNHRIRRSFGHHWLHLGKRGSPSDISNCKTLDIGVTPSTAKDVWEPKMGVTRAYLTHAAPCICEFFTSASSVVLARMVTYSHTTSAFVKTTPTCRVFQVHVQVRHRHDAAASAVALSTGDKKNKTRCLPKAQESETCILGGHQNLKHTAQNLKARL